jgi:hypothetical protein
LYLVICNLAKSNDALKIVSKCLGNDLSVLKTCLLIPMSSKFINHFWSLSAYFIYTTNLMLLTGHLINVITDMFSEDTALGNEILNSKCNVTVTNYLHRYKTQSMNCKYNQHCNFTILKNVKKRKIVLKSLKDHYTNFKQEFYEQAQSNRACNIFNFAVLGFLWDFFISLNLSPHQLCLCRVEAVKCRPVHSIKDVIFSFSTTLFLCLWYFSSFYSAIFLFGGPNILTCGLLFKFVFWRHICDMQTA